MPTEPTEQNNRKASELTRLKQLWKKWPDAERQKVLGWREEEIEPGKLITNAIIRARIKKYYQVNLVRDGQMSEFWSWAAAFMEEQAMQEYMVAREQALIDQHPQLSRDAIRDALIKEWYAWAKAKRDPKLGLAVVKMDLKDRVVSQDERRIVLLEKKAEAYDRAQAALSEAKNSKGGITTETLEKIERELKLL